MQTEPIMLVAEDDDGHFYLLKRELKRIGIAWPIRRFSDGQQALDFLFRQFVNNPDGPAIFLLDLRLPKVSGTEILARIRSSDSPSLRELPTVVITSSCNPDDSIQCRRLGCDAYLTKPFSAAQLQSVFHSVLPAALIGQTA
jgi:CheY-like chemotaxis protein